MTALRILTWIVPTVASTQTLAFGIGDAVHGKEALLFTSGITVFTLALFAVFFALALRQKRS